MAKKIPEFTSDKEAADFWATHSLADFEQDLEEAKDILFVRPKKQTITIRMDKKYIDAIRAIASKKGIGHSPLMRMWIIERLDQEKSSFKSAEQ